MVSTAITMAWVVRVVEAAVEMEVIMVENVFFRTQKTAYHLLRPPSVLPYPIRQDLPQKIKSMQWPTLHDQTLTN
jgi:hypothetical protein